jgi:hypothetical protein
VRRIVNKYTVCKNFFCQLTGVSRNTLSVVQQGFTTSGDLDPSALLAKRYDAKKPDNQIPEQDQPFWAPAAQPVGREQEDFSNVVSEEIIKNFGEALPHRTLKNPDSNERRTQVNIPNGLFPSRSSLFDLLKDTRRIRSTLSLQTFYRWLTRFFWFVSFRKWTPFSKCDICVGLKQRWLGSAGNQAQADQVKEELQAHRETVAMARLRLAFRSLLACAFPALFLHVIMDGMDSAKTWSPHVITHAVASKGLSDKGDNLKTKLTGVLAEGRWFQGFVTYPHYKEGANVMVTILHDALLRHVEWYGCLPQVLFLQMDNCGRDNKNHTMLAYLGYLVQKEVFTEIYLDFLPVGKHACLCFALCPDVPRCAPIERIGCDWLNEIYQE